MKDFVLFPQVKNAIAWLEGHGDTIMQFGWNIAAAVILLFVGKLVSKLLSKTIERILLRRNVDATVVHFFAAIVRYITMAFAIVAALGRVGIETSSIIAVIGAAGLAIGLALQGSLSNFAAGVLLVTLRPFRAGNFVQVGAVSGVVQTVHVFSTTLLTVDNKEVVIPNGKIIADSIVNYSRHPYRRIDLLLGVAYQSRIAEVKNVIQGVVDKESRIDKSRGTTVRLIELGPSTLNFTVRVWVKNVEYWDTYFDLLETIKESLDEHNIVLPGPRMDIQLVNSSQQALIQRAS
ncbi:mechanosensitive ion channel domain-containing protein [Raoultella terrigena]|uniref:mechanosensitive ion channel domain-containing protein n=1 Tax=Raoultella terrigena TaxID=577 RepID=UPI003BAD74BB